MTSEPGIVQISKADLKQGRMPAHTLLVRVGLAPSYTEARRLINKKKAKIDGETIYSADSDLDITTGTLVSIEDRNAFRIRLVD